MLTTWPEHILLFLLAAICLSFAPAQAQECYSSETEPLVLSSQEAVDNFNCTEVAWLRVGRNWPGGPGTDISDLGGLAGLTEVSASFVIFDNPLLTDLSGLSSLSSVGSLTIQSNPGLASLSGLSSLSSVGVLTIETNHGLTSLSGLPALSSLGSLTVYDNRSLQNLEGLPQVNGRLNIYENSALTSLDGLSVSANLSAINITNSSLVNIDALQGVSAVWGQVDIRGNDALENVDGLSGLRRVQVAIWLENNGVLGACSTGLCPIIAEGGADHGIYISNNSLGCSSLEEVQESCLTGVEDDELPNIGLVEVYPNPFVGTVSVAYTLAIPAAVRLVVYDALGRYVGTLAEGSQSAGSHVVDWEALGLATGTYIVRLEIGAEVWTKHVNLVR